MKEGELQDFESYTSLNAEYSGLERPKRGRLGLSSKEVLAFDRANYLVDDVLKVTDVASMMNGVEVRLPFLDNEVVSSSELFTPSALFKKGTKTP